MNLRITCSRALVCLLLCVAPLEAGVLSGDGIGVYGDSLSWQYSLWVPLSTGFGYPLFSNGQQFNWVDHLSMSGYNFGPQADFTGQGNFYDRYDAALGGAVSSDLPGQVTKLQSYLASNAVKLTVLEIGGNNFGPGGQYQSIYNKAANVSYNPLTDSAVQTFSNALIANLTTAVNSTLALNPNEHMILATVPDLGDTPMYRAQYTDASRRADVTTVVQQINQRILSLAALHHFPVVDLNGMTSLALNPPTLAGVPILPGGGNGGNLMYLSDGFHPSTVANGLLANAILKANQIGYGDPVNLVSDQTIVTRAGLVPTGGGPTYYDVSPYVIFAAVPEPSSIALASIAAIALAIAARRRRNVDVLHD